MKPSKPVAATLGVVIEDGCVLLVRRSNPPDAGRWSFPGGKIRFGESIRAAAIRELEEETGIKGEVGEIFTAVEALDETDGFIHQHFVLIAVLCRRLSGEIKAGDDAAEARWFPISGLAEAGLARSFDLVRVVHQACFAMRETSG